MKRLKVYGWTQWNHDKRVVAAANGSIQTRMVMAAHSIAEIMRTHDLRKSDLFCICETGNADEITVALARPLTVFWKQPNDTYRRAAWFAGIER